MRQRYLQSRCLAAGQGFTLVELAVVVAILAIVSAIAAPSFNNLIRGNRLTSSANEMVAMLQIARIAAVSKRSSVSVCPSANGTTCDAAVGRRWIALSAKEGVLRDSVLNDAVTVTSSPNLSGASNKITFTPNGFSAAGAASGGTIGMCDPKMTGNNSVDVSANTGRISTARRAATAACAVPGDN
ncbi:MAG: GspH/FimT family pseudopilin [Thermomonas sp.]